MKYSSTLDISKYILSLMIVAIHSALFPNILYPWLRLAVPLFFIISSYILFYRIKAEGDERASNLVKNYIKRNLQLYLFWFILLFPITVYVRCSWLDGGLIAFFKTFIPQLLFSSTFVASWFIIASVWAVIILFFTRKISWKIMLPVLSVVYIICCLRSSYYFLLERNDVISNIVYYYESIFTSPVFSFPVATFWMYIGKLFTELKGKTVFSKQILIKGVVVFAVCLWIEWKVVIKLGGFNNNDCYIFLAPLVFCIFALMKDIDINCKYSKILRTISTVTYPLHASLVVIVSGVFSHLIGLNYSWLNFIITVICCHLATFIILKLENVRWLRFLKYSH